MLLSTKKSALLLAILTGCHLIVACNSNSDDEILSDSPWSTPEEPRQSAAKFYCDVGFVQKNKTTAGFDYNDFSCAYRAQDDIYQHVNQGWIGKTTIPDGKGYIGVGSETSRRNNEFMINRLKELAASPSETYSSETPQGKAVILFRQANNVNELSSLGLKPILPYLEKITAATKNSELIDLMVNDPGVYSYPISLKSDINEYTSLKYAPTIRGSDYPLLLLSQYNPALVGSSDKAKAVQAQYVEVAAQYLKAADPNATDISQRSNNVLTFLQKLIATQTPEGQQTKDSNTFRKLNELPTVLPTLRWVSPALTKLGLANAGEVLVMDNAHLNQAAKLIDETPLQTLKDYQILGVMDVVRLALPQPLSAARVKLSQMLGGSTFDTREAFVLNSLSVGSIFPQAMGRIFVDGKFPEKNKVAAKKIASDIISAFKERLKTRAWLSEGTKQKAIAKVDAMTVLVGYPDKWIDYSTMDVRSNKSLMDNLLTMNQWGEKRQLMKAGQAFDRLEWNYGYHKTDAFYSPDTNTIFFSAAIIQEPLFSLDSDPALNYGGFGQIVGHEVTHGFDPIGSQYGPNGELGSWFTEEERKQFDMLGNQITEQYNSLELIPGLYANGKLSIGENMADSGGVANAYAALDRELQTRDVGLIDGTTQRQRFFLTLARNFRNKYNDDYLKNYTATDPHPAGIARANIPIKNFTPFYEVWGVKPTDAMYLPPEKRVEVW